MTFDLPGEPEAGSTHALQAPAWQAPGRPRLFHRAAPVAYREGCYFPAFANSTTALSMSPTDMMPTSFPLASTTHRP